MIAFAISLVALLIIVEAWLLFSIKRDKKELSLKNQREDKPIAREAPDKKTKLMQVLGIIAIVLPLILSYYWVVGFAMGFMNPIYGLFSLIFLILYFYSAISFIRRKFAIWKLIIVLFGLFCYFGPIAFHGISFYLSPYRKVYIAKNQRDVSAVKKSLDKVAGKGGDSYHAVMGKKDLGAIHYGQGDYLQALKFFSDKNIYTSDKFKVAIYVKLGELSKALESCENLIATVPYRKEDLYFFRGNVHYFFKDYEKAILDYSKAIEMTLKPCASNKFYIARANAYAVLKKLDLALQDYDRAIKSQLVSNDNSGDSDYQRCSYLYGHFYRAEYYFFTKQNDKAKEDLAYIIKKSRPWNQVRGEANILMGYIYDFENNKKAASDYYEEAKRITDGWDGRGNIWGSVRVRKTLRGLIGADDVKGETFDEYSRSLDRYVVEDYGVVTNKIYLDTAILESVPRLFDYSSEGMD